MAQESVLCAERGQPVRTGDQIFFVTVSGRTTGHIVSGEAISRVPVTKRLQSLSPNERGLHVYETTTKPGTHIPAQGEFRFCVGELMAAYLPTIFQNN